MAASQAPESCSDSKQVLLIVLSVLFMVVTVFGISFRLYSRLFVLRKVFAEDGLMLVGTVFALGLSSIFVTDAYHGYGTHFADIQTRPANQTLLYNLTFAISLVYAATTLFVKFSFLMLYLRIDDRKPMRWTVYTLMAIIIGQALMTTTVMSLSYIVPSQWGDASQGDASNIRIKPVTAQAFWNAADVMSAVTSTAVYVAPFFILRGLQLPKRQKWGVAVLLGLGILPVAASCIKTYYIWSMYLSRDVYYQIVNAAIWVQVEVHLAILCSSVQTYRVLLRGFCPRCCRSPDDGCTTEHEAASFPPQSPMRSAESLSGQFPAGTFDSWANWEPSISEESSAYMKGNASRTPSPTGNNGVATVPAGMRQQFPSIAARIGGEGPNVWLFEAAQDKRFSPPWPLSH
ncbi:hypothetical protein M409DRAFT_22081 [Zasmidium cellare ATCC 36951]|uniref:Rhodopsin domain-containing protein n=1 Tax=Zasmidium cellare ATCC 36951 TaxID=1080233 RepID=A0A6A6CR25_ZASCE|nr:uncharacterized protein M409DRAFT_22081 [Zasmidium cellare ATCC 36951]KAF2167936.1 hypothetical protein M409DRAFT_22081 [Zasmidium cellare ATCC 36951]